MKFELEWEPELLLESGGRGCALGLPSFARPGKLAETETDK